jgi:RHS repeat-associated protein
MDEFRWWLDLVDDTFTFGSVSRCFGELRYRNVVCLRRSRGLESNLRYECQLGRMVEHANLRSLLGHRWECIMNTHAMPSPRRLSVVALVVSTMLGTLGGDLATRPASAATIDPGAISAFRHGIRSALRTAHTGGTQVYTPGELYGGSNSVALCFTCEASTITGTAPPSASLDEGSGVSTLTGDYSYNLNLFSAHGFGTSMSDALTYDAQLAQAQLTAGQGPGPLGYGWNSTWTLSATPGVSSTEVVNEGSGAQDTFNESASNGTSTSCPTGDQTTTNRYTMQSVTSAHQWCALANVQAQFADVSSSGLYFQRSGGQTSDGFYWNGSFAYNEGQVTGVAEYPNVAPGYELTPSPNPLECPSTAHYCDILDNGDDQRQILEAFNSSEQITEIEGPIGTAYFFTYSGGNLTSVTGDTGVGSSGTSVWNFVYDTASSPYSSDLVQIYDPDSGVGSSPLVSPGAAHSNYIAYNNSGTYVGMVNQVQDGTGAITTYTYANSCSTGTCVLAGNTQASTVTYPQQPPCPGCTTVSPQETDFYTSGVQTKSILGAAGGGANSETWQYAWSLGYGAANSTETITYPDSLSGSSPTATIVLDPAGNVVSTTNAAGDVATSAYNDVGANVLPELLWSYPGSSTNGPLSPPSGSEVYTYDSQGYVQSETDPLGNITKFGYYTGGQVLCYVEPPTVAVGTGSPGTCSLTSGEFSGPGSTPPVGSTAYSYDDYGDTSGITVDFGDTATGSDPQTTTSSYDLMNDAMWSIPSAGQSGAQSALNSYATSADYYANGLVSYVTKPGQGTTTYTYDANFNLVKVQTPYSSVYQMAVFDGDNRPCYQLTSTLQTGLTCSSGSQAGSTTTTYVSGSTSPATVKDGNGHTTSYYYGDLAFPNSPTEVVDAANSAVQYTAYDDYGYPCDTGSQSIAIGTSTQCNTVSGDTKTAYNALGDETSIADPSGNTTSITYTNTAFPTLKTSETNALSAATGYTYNADGELTTISNPDTTSVTTAYDADGRVCVQADNGSTYSCGGGTGVAGVTTYGYNGANDRTSMTTYSPSTLATTYAYSNGQLTSTTDSNVKVTSYLYNYAGQVQCETYPVSTSTTCGTLSSPATGSTTNTIVTRGYDGSGRLSTVKDWLGNTTTYAYTKPSAPLAVTSITYPSSTGLTSTMTQDNDGSLATLTAGSSISDSWSYDADQRVSTLGVNGTTSAAAIYNANNQVTGATNLATSTKNDSYTMLANGSITSDATPVQSTTSYGYNAGGELCWSANVPTSSSACGSPPSGASATTSYAYTANGERTSTTSTSPSTGSNISAVGSIAQSVANGDSTLSVNPQHVGDALVLGISVNASNPVTSVSGGGATWKFLARETGSYLGNTELWLGTVTSTGSSTITVAYTTSIGSTYVDIAAQEFTDGTGVSTTWSEDTSGTLNNNGVTTVTLPTLTASTSGELYVGLAFTNNPVTAGSTSGFTYDSLYSGLYTFNANMSGTVTPTATMTSGYYGSVGVTLAASAPSTISSVGSLQENVGTGVTTLSVNPQHVGDALVLSALVSGGQSVTSISGGGATWQKLAHGYTGTYGEEELWLGTVSATGISTITVSFSSSVSGSMIALTSQEFTNGTGPSTTWANDVGGGNNGYSSTVTFPTLKPTRSSGELYVGVANAANTPSAGSTSGFTYDIVPYQIFVFNPSITTTSTPTATQSATGNFESTAALIRAGVPSTSTTHYAWNPYGELCNVSVAVSTSCGSTPPTGTSYTYNGDGLRMTVTAAVTVGPTTTTTTTDSTWDYVSGGSIPLNINDAATSGSTTTNTSYVYGDLLFGGTAPIEQLVTTGSGTTAVFLVASPQGVQGAYSSTGALQELATYSSYGVQTISSGSRVTPFGFQGSYTDSTGFIYLINRYYDPTTDQFMSIDPDVDETDQPYSFVDDDPLNDSDALGNAALALNGGGVPTLQQQQDATVALEDDALQTLGVAQTVIETINKTLEGQVNSFTEQFASEDMDGILSEISRLKEFSSILIGLQIAGFAVEDYSEGDGIGYSLGDALTSGAVMEAGASGTEAICAAFVENPVALVACGVVGSAIGTVAGHDIWNFFWTKVLGKKK